MTFSTPSSGLELTGISKRFGGADVLTDISFGIEKGELLVVLGPSGCGKSTLLRLIAGLEAPDSGSVSICGERVDRTPPGRRDVAMVFQNHALYPHMTVRQNIVFGLKSRSLSKAEIEMRVEQTAEALEISDLLHRNATSLSGGQRQRVAIGRAMVKQPRLFMFDEPLSNLDASLRVRMRQEIRELHRKVGATTVLVTHDQAEAMSIADKIIILNNSKIEQIAPPCEIYNRPTTRFAAEFVGVPQINMFRVQDLVEISPFASPPSNSCPQAATHVGFRPESIRLCPLDAGDINARIDYIEYVGDRVHLGLSTKSGLKVRATSHNGNNLRPNEAVGIQLNKDAALYFDVDGKYIAEHPRQHLINRPA